MRAIAVVLAGSLVAAGCGANTYRIPTSELARLAQLPPETRGQHVRVIEDVVESDVPAQAPITGETRVVVVPQIDIDGAIVPRHPAGGGVGGGGHGGPGKIGGSGADGKAAAIAVLVIAATAAVTAAAVEGSRFDGWAQLHPMQPVHLIGKDGQYAVMPLAWIDPRAAAFTDEAVIRSTEGPMLELERAPLTRRGLTYSMYGGIASMRSADGTTEMGSAWTIQLGGFITEQVGVMLSESFSWRDNLYNATLFENRSTVEVQVLPIAAGILHAGVYGGGGVAQRFEDAIKLSGSEIIAGDDTSPAIVGGAMFQLDFNTRLALTARFGVTYAHGEQQHDAMIGLAVY